MRPDVIVIGAGVWGLSLAWHLAAVHRAAVRVLDRRMSPGAETSTRAAGQIGQVREQPFTCNAARYALDFAASLARRRDPRAFMRSGSLALIEGVAAASALRPRFAQASAAGVAVEIVAPDDVRRLVPALRGEFAAAYHVPCDGYVDPGRYVAALATDVRELGVVVDLGTTVVGIDADAGGLRGVETLQGRLAGGMVAVTAGPWTSTVMSELLPVTPVALGQARTVPADIEPLHPVVRFPEHGLYVRPEKSGYLFGSFSRHVLDAPPHTVARAERTEMLEPDYPTLDDARQRLGQFLPDVARLPVDHFRQGWTTFSPDGLPVAGRRAGASSVWFATGCGATGYVWAAELGRLLARSIVEGQPVPELAALDAGRFGPRAHDAAWVRDAGRRRFADYYGLDGADDVRVDAGPSAEHFAWK